MGCQVSHNAEEGTNRHGPQISTSPRRHQLKAAEETAPSSSVEPALNTSIFTPVSAASTPPPPMMHMHPRSRPKSNADKPWSRLPNDTAAATGNPPPSSSIENSKKDKSKREVESTHTSHGETDSSKATGLLLPVSPTSPKEFNPRKPVAAGTKTHRSRTHSASSRNAPVESAKSTAESRPIELPANTRGKEEGEGSNQPKNTPEMKSAKLSDGAASPFSDNQDMLPANAIPRGNRGGVAGRTKRNTIISTANDSASGISSPELSPSTPGFAPRGTSGGGGGARPKPPPPMILSLESSQRQDNEKTSPQQRRVSSAAKGSATPVKTKEGSTYSKTLNENSGGRGMGKRPSSKNSSKNSPRLATMKTPSGSVSPAAMDSARINFPAFSPPLLNDVFHAMSNSPSDMATPRSRLLESASDRPPSNVTGSTKIHAQSPTNTTLDSPEVRETIRKEKKPRGNLDDGAYTPEAFYHFYSDKGFGSTEQYSDDDGNSAPNAQATTQGTPKFIPLAPKLPSDSYLMPVLPGSRAGRRQRHSAPKKGSGLGYHPQEDRPSVTPLSLLSRAPTAPPGPDSSSESPHLIDGQPVTREASAFSDFRPPSALLYCGGSPSPIPSALGNTALPPARSSTGCPSGDDDTQTNATAKPSPTNSSHARTSVTVRVSSAYIPPTLTPANKTASNSTPTHKLEPRIVLVDKPKTLQPALMRDATSGSKSENEKENAVYSVGASEGSPSIFNVYSPASSANEGKNSAAGAPRSSMSDLGMDDTYSIYDYEIGDANGTSQLVSPTKNVNISSSLAKALLGAKEGTTGKQNKNAPSTPKRNDVKRPSTKQDEPKTKSSSDNLTPRITPTPPSSMAANSSDLAGSSMPTVRTPPPPPPTCKSPAVVVSNNSFQESGGPDRMFELDSLLFNEASVSGNRYLGTFPDGSFSLQTDSHTKRKTRAENDNNHNNTSEYTGTGYGETQSDCSRGISVTGTQKSTSREQTQHPSGFFSTPNAPSTAAMHAFNVTSAQPALLTSGELSTSKSISQPLGKPSTTETYESSGRSSMNTSKSPSSKERITPDSRGVRSVSRQQQQQNSHHRRRKSASTDDDRLARYSGLNNNSGVCTSDDDADGSHEKGEKRRRVRRATSKDAPNNASSGGDKKDRSSKRSGTAKQSPALHAFSESDATLLLNALEDTGADSLQSSAVGDSEYAGGGLRRMDAILRADAGIMEIPKLSRNSAQSPDTRSPQRQHTRNLSNPTPPPQFLEQQRCTTRQRNMSLSLSGGGGPPLRTNTMSTGGGGGGSTGTPVSKSPPQTVVRPASRFDNGNSPQFPLRTNTLNTIDGTSYQIPTHSPTVAALLRERIPSVSPSVSRPMSHSDRYQSRDSRPQSASYGANQSTSLNASISTPTTIGSPRPTDLMMLTNGVKQRQPTNLKKMGTGIESLGGPQKTGLPGLTSLFQQAEAVDPSPNDGRVSRAGTGVLGQPSSRSNSRNGKGKKHRGSSAQDMWKPTEVVQMEKEAEREKRAEKRRVKRKAKKDKEKLRRQRHEALLKEKLQRANMNDDLLAARTAIAEAQRNAGSMDDCGDFLGGPLQRRQGFESSAWLQVITRPPTSINRDENDESATSTFSDSSDGDSGEYDEAREHGRGHQYGTAGNTGNVPFDSLDGSDLDNPSTCSSSNDSDISDVGSEDDLQ